MVSEYKTKKNVVKKFVDFNSLRNTFRAYLKRTNSIIQKNMQIHPSLNNRLNVIVVIKERYNFTHVFITVFEIPKY